MSIQSRRIWVAVGFIVLILGLGGAYLLFNMKEPPKTKPEIDQTKVIDTLHIQNGSIPAPMSLQGELEAFDKIELYAEVSGTLLETSRPFKVGTYFPKGSVLIRIDDEEARLNLLSQKSNLLNAITQMMPDMKIDQPKSFENWVRYLEGFELEGKLKDLPESITKQEQFFVAARNIYSQFYSIRSAEERLTKYTLKAPFSGVLTQTNTNPGALVRIGQNLGELMNTSQYELTATIPLSDLKFVRKGYSVKLYSDAVNGAWNGRIVRINDQVDPGTQTVKVFIKVSGNGLREGMYLRGEVVGSEVVNAALVPKNLLVDQTQLYVVEKNTIQLKQVQVIRLSTTGAIVRGLSNGTILLAEPIPGAYSGLPIRIRGEAPSNVNSSTVPDNSISSTR